MTGGDEIVGGYTVTRKECIIYFCYDTKSSCLSGKVSFIAPERQPAETIRSLPSSALSKTLHKLASRQNTDNDSHSQPELTLKEKKCLQPAPAATFKTIGGMLDFYVFTGPTPEKVVQQYTKRVGRHFMPPYWALGFHLCRWDYGGTSGLKQVITQMRNARVPYDTQWNDIDYMHNHLDWTYDPSGQFAGLPAVVEDLHAQGQHYIIIIICTGKPLYSAVRYYIVLDIRRFKDVPQKFIDHVKK